MDLSIITLNYKSKGLVKQCLAGIQAAPPRLSYEIIVVDNSTDDELEEIIMEKFPAAKYVPAPKNLGYAAGNNLGIRQASGSYILILNPDVAVTEGAIEKMVDFLELNPRVAIAGPKLVHPDRAMQFSCYHFPTWDMPLYRRTWLGKFSFGQRKLQNYLMLDWDHQNPRAVDWLLGACLLVRQRAIEQVGLLDEKFFLYFEDVDWCRRFWQSGYQVFYYPEAEMFHYYQRQSAESGLWNILNKPNRAHIMSWLRYFWKWGVKN